MQIKVCGLKYPENISDILETNVDYLGMIFHPQSARFVSSANNYKNIPNAKKVAGCFNFPYFHAAMSNIPMIIPCAM